MSLDVTLYYPSACAAPCEHCSAKPREVFDGSITHNLGAMAEAAGLYTALWHPEKGGIVTAVQLLYPLRDGLRELRTNPERFSSFAPPNGWGKHADLVEFVIKYLAAADAHPNALVKVSR